MVDFAGLAKIVGALGSLGTGMASAFQKQEYPPGLRESMQALANAQTYAAAASDPTSSYFKNVAHADESKRKLEILGAIMELARANNRAAARGVYGVGVNPERRDENTYRTVVRAFQQAGLEAQTRARQTLLDAARVNAGVGGMYGGAMRYGAATDLMNRTNRNSGFNALFGSLPNIAKGLKGIGSKSSSGDDPIWGAGAWGHADWYRPQIAVSGSPWAGIGAMANAYQPMIDLADV